MNFHKEHEEAVFAEAMNLVEQFEPIYREHGSGALMQAIYSNVERTLDKAGIWEKASCKGACSFCCHDTIMMPPIEAEYIQETLLFNNITGDKRRKELQSSGEQIKWIDKACPYLLDEDEEGRRLCSIYEIRPMVCRTHNSTEDPKFCNKEEYPDRFINEGRIIAVEAVTLALMIMKHEVDDRGFPKMNTMHEMK